jgi:hypothetical protein
MCNYIIKKYVVVFDVLINMHVAVLALTRCKPNTACACFGHLPLYLPKPGYYSTRRAFCTYRSAAILLKYLLFISVRACALPTLEVILFC